jgi:hypothetical protein
MDMNEELIEPVEVLTEVEVERVEQEIEEDLIANDDGTLSESDVYRDKRTGNIVMNPKIRAKNQDNGRREKCWNLYLKSVRDGNPNARGAAREAGFSENTAINIGNMAWFKERKDKLRRSKMMNNAERNIARILNMGYTEIRKLEDGTDKEVVDKDVLRVVADMSKTIVTTLGKDLGYSTKTEVKVEQLPTPILQLDAIDVIPPQIEESNEPVIE